MALVGFSQGAMMALHVALSLPESIGGVVAFSGALIPPAGFPETARAQPPGRWLSARAGARAAAGTARRRLR